jgi:hypothetical protein
VVLGGHSVNGTGSSSVTSCHSTGAAHLSINLSLMLNVRKLITPCNRVLLEKLTQSQLVKKFPAFYGTRRFITVFTRVRKNSSKIKISRKSVQWEPSCSTRTDRQTHRQTGMTKIRKFCGTRQKMYQSYKTAVDKVSK